MLKSISAALFAISLLAAPALAGTGHVKTEAKIASPASTAAAASVKLSPKVANAFARHGGRHHMGRHHMRRPHHHMGRHHHMRRHHMHRHHHHHMRMYRR